MGNHLNKLSFQLTDSDWTNRLSVVSNDIDAEISGTGHVSINGNGTNSSRAARDVSFDIVQRDVDELVGNMNWIRNHQYPDMDMITILVWLNIFILILNACLLGKNLFKMKLLKIRTKR